MIKIIFSILFFLILIFSPGDIFAKTNSFISVVNPVRGNDFWDLNNQKITDAIKGQVEILEKYNLPATWLIRFDALENKEVLNILGGRKSDENGLFLEVTPSWTSEAVVDYRESESWHLAGSVLLTGYDPTDREKLIDKAFDKFKETFGNYPRSVGAWWIDSHSLSYMQEKYKITGALIVSDQYTTDNYQIWGQYFSTPYYPSKNNALHPAQTLENKLPIVITQWAPRDPVNSYGNGVFESTFSVQPNDYLDFHDLDISYFAKLIDIYTTQKFNKFSQLVVGLENTYYWEKYKGEYENQIRYILEKQGSGQVFILTLKDFSNWYQSNFPQLSPEQIIIADDPLGSSKKVVWFMNSFYRAGWFFNKDGSVFRDIRQYIDGQEELCFRARCEEVNFATSATRVLDEVSFGHKWIIDRGKISNFRITRKDEKYIINYQNEAGTLRQIEFLPRDIAVDGKIFSIDGAILDATKKENITSNTTTNNIDSSLKISPVSVFLKIGKFLTFLILAVMVPGLILTGLTVSKNTPFLLRLFISLVTGLVTLTFLFYIASLLNLKFTIFLYILLSLFIFIRFKFYKLQFNLHKIKTLLDLILVVVVLAGVVFQTIPTFKSGLNFSFGVGFWGPNTHDGIWHIALINQLIGGVPPENPIFSGQVLKNYHYFYDLLIAATAYLSRVPVLDLVFRFYPLVFSIMLGVGSYYLVIELFEKRMGVIRTKVANIFSLYLIFFAGSFGWIVEYLREKHLGGESAFWVNQAVSFNLNPPFAISLIILVTLLHILFSDSNTKLKGVVSIILAGTLIGFKSYTGILVLGTLIIVATVKLLRSRNFSFAGITLLSLITSVWLFLSNFDLSSSLIIFAPFWFIHSMVDSPDRVGWERLSLARVVGLESKNWFKFISAEVISFLIFIFGNLGMRFFSLGSLLKIKEILRDDQLLFILILSAASLALPILFIQSGNPWNTIQFFYPVLFTSSIFSGVVISLLISKLKRILASIFISAVVIFVPINSLVTASGYLSNTPHALVSPKELEALEFLSKQPDGVILTYPYNEKLKQKISEPWSLIIYGSTAYVSAFSQKSVYLEDEPQNQILLTDYTKRLVASKDFFQRPISQGVNFLHENNIKYVYLPKIHNAQLENGTDIIKKIFENEEATIFQIKLLSINK